MQKHIKYIKTTNLFGVCISKVSDVKLVFTDGRKVQEGDGHGEIQINEAEQVCAAFAVVRNIPVSIKFSTCFFFILFYLSEPTFV